jgi:hypothetical protein
MIYEIFFQIVLKILLFVFKVKKKTTYFLGTKRKRIYFCKETPKRFYNFKL